MSAQIISPARLKERCAQDENLQIVDVREPAEFKSERMSGTQNEPLSALAHNIAKLDKSKTVYLLCGTGKRAGRAADLLGEHGFNDLCVIEGGLVSCKASGVSVEGGQTGAWSLERQVRFAAGMLVGGGILLAWLIHPGFIGFSAFVAVGLIFSAVTDTCGMAMILARAPWNK